MRKLILSILTLALLAGAGAAFAGTVYVPLVIDQDSGGNFMETAIRVTNISETDDRVFSYLTIFQNTDGTDRNEDDVQEILLVPRGSIVLKGLVARGQRAMVEISGGSEIAVSARLEGTNAQSEQILGAEIPVISSANAVNGGSEAVLQGWIREDQALFTDFHLVNLGSLEATCLANIYDGNGSRLLRDFSFTQRPLSQSTFTDVLSLINIVNRDEITARFNCNQTFFPFATVSAMNSGEMLLIHPSGTGASQLQPPGDGGLPPVVPGATTFSRPGVFHVPTVGNESIHFDVPMPGNPVFSKIILDMEFFHGGWHPRSGDNHGIFWLNRGDRWRNNLFGYFNTFGPNTNTIKLSTNADLGAGNIRAETVGAVLNPGTTYQVHFEYDTNLNVYFAEISVNGTVIRRVSDVPTVNAIRTVDNNWFVAFGHESGAIGPEVPTYGWRYSNLRVQWIP